MRTLLTLCVLLPLSLSAAEPQLQGEFERMTQIDDFVSNGPTFLPGDSLEKVRALDRVVREVSTTEKNPHAEGEVRYTKITFEHGLEIQLRTFGSPIQLQFIRVIITSSKWPIKDGLVVGTPVSRVIEVLGTPAKESSDWIEYSGVTQHVSFAVAKGRISKAVFDFYAD